MSSLSPEYITWVMAVPVTQLKCVRIGPAAMMPCGHAAMGNSLVPEWVWHEQRSWNACGT